MCGSICSGWDDNIHYRYINVGKGRPRECYHLHVQSISTPKYLISSRGDSSVRQVKIRMTYAIYKAFEYIATCLWTGTEKSVWFDNISLKPAPTMFYKRKQCYTKSKHVEVALFQNILSNEFCRFWVVIRFFHPHHNGQWPPTSKNFLSKIVSITFIFLS